MPRRSDEDDEGADVGHVEAIKETDLALLVRTDDGDETWVPKSVIHPSSTVQGEGDHNELVLMTWWHDANWGAHTPAKKPASKAPAQALGVSDLGRFEKLLRSKGVQSIAFYDEGAIASAPPFTGNGKDLIEAVRLLDKARRE